MTTKMNKIERDGMVAVLVLLGLARMEHLE